ANSGDEISYDIYAEDIYGNATYSTTITYGIFTVENPILLLYNGSDYGIETIERWWTNFWPAGFDAWDINNDGINELNDALAEYNYVIQLDGSGPIYDLSNYAQSYLSSGTTDNPKAYFLSSQDYGYIVNYTGQEDKYFSPGSFQYDYLGVEGIINQEFGCCGDNQIELIPISDMYLSEWAEKYNNDNGTSYWYRPFRSLSFDNWIDAIDVVDGGNASVFMYGWDGSQNQVVGVSNYGDGFYTAFITYDYLGTDFRGNPDVEWEDDPDAQWSYGVGNQAGKFLEWAGLSWSVSISEIQIPTDTTDISPYEGMIVNTTGIVTGVSPYGYGYYLQDGAGSWNGIWVYDRTNVPEVGDNVTLAGVVMEYYGWTEINWNYLQVSFTINSSGNTLPDATLINTGELGEEFESVLVKFQNAEVTNPDLGDGEWEVDDGSGSAIIDNYLYTYVPILGDIYNITGICRYSQDEFNLDPRDENDINFSSGGADIAVTFNCNMEYEIESGRFDPDNDSLFVRGSFNDWTTENHMMSTGDGSYNFQTTINFYESEGNQFSYKFYYETHNDHWEYGDDRVYTFTADDVSNGSMNIERTFNDFGPDDLTNNRISILFTCDVNGAVNFDTGSEFDEITSVSIVGQPYPLLWPSPGWPDEDIQYAHQLNDIGVEGDETAGDNIWSLEIFFSQYTWLDFDYKYCINWGDPANEGDNDNEAGDYDNHFLTITPDFFYGKVQNQFGHMGQHDLVDIIYNYNSNITVKVINYDGTSSPIPGSNAYVNLWNRYGVEFGTAQSNSNGEAVFNDLPNNIGYYFFVRSYQQVDPDIYGGSEYWGDQTDVMVNGDKTINFTREMPYLANTRVYDSGSNDVTGQAVELNETLTIKLTVTNPNDVSRQTSAALVLDNDKLSPWDYNSSKATIISGNNSFVFEYEYTPTSDGDYFTSVGVKAVPGDIYEYTDRIGWGDDPLFNVQEEINPIISTSVDTMYFGDVQIDNEADQILTISNDGTSDLIVTNISASDDAYTINTTGFTIGPGTQRQVTVTFRPTEEKEYSAQLEIESNATNATDGKTYVLLNGNGVPTPTAIISLSSYSINFGEVQIDNASDQTITVTNNGEADLNVTNITSNEGAFEVSSTIFTLSPGTNKQLTITFTPTEQRQYSGQITIESNASNSSGGNTFINVEGEGVPDPTALISVSANSINFGDVTINQEVNQQLTVTNTGEADLNVTNITSSDEAFQVSTTSFTLSPDGSKQVTITFRPTEERTYDEQIVIQSNASNTFNGQTSITVNGVGVPNPTATITLSSNTINFGDVTIDQEAQHVLTVENTGSADLIVTDILSDESEFSVDIISFTLSPQAMKQVTITFIPTEEKSYNGQILIESNAANASGGYTSVTVNGNGVPNPTATITISSNSINFGDVTVDQQADLQLTITNTGTADLVVTNFTSDDDAFSISSTSFTLSPAADKQVTITFIPTEARSYSATLTITSNAANAPGGITSITISGNGIPAAAPVIELSSNTINFGDVTVNQQSDQNLTISNTGTADLVVLNITSDNNVFTVNLTSFTISQGSDQQVTITFLPTEVTSYSGTITIQSNASNAAGGITSITVSGNGITAAAPVIELSSNTINFGDVTVNQESDQQLTVENTGSADLVVTNITSDDNAFTVNPTSFTVNQGSNQQVTITFTPTDVTSYSGTITIQNNASNASGGNTSVAVNGNGIALPSAEISLSNSTLDFGSVELNQSSSQNITINSTGDAELSITNISSSDGAFTSDKTSLTITSGGSDIISITFSPGEVKYYSGTVSIESNASNAVSGITDVGVSGTGTLPAMPASYDLSHTISYASRTYAMDYSSNEYKIIGFPGSGNNIVSNYLSGSQGTNWEVYWDNGDPSSDINVYLVKYNGSETFNCYTGRAFWVIHKGNISISSNVATAPLNSEDEIEIDIHSGWNAITNPFDQQMLWSKVQEVNDVAEPIHGYNGGFSQSSNFSPYSGYYFYNDEANPKTVLKVPYEALFTAPTFSLNKETDLLVWEIKINLETEEYKDLTTSIGVAEDAKDDIDKYDYRKPRGISKQPSIYLPRSEWTEYYNIFCRDIR
ncbi:choice-of-anchor D domain-containing protein, partial [Bacteroidota bacterium]